MSLLRYFLGVTILVSTPCDSFSQSITDFRSAATKAFPSTVAATVNDKDGNAWPARQFSDQHQSRLRSMLRPSNQSIMIFDNQARLPFIEPSVAGFAVAPDLVIVALTGSVDDAVQLQAAGQKELEAKIVANDFVTGLSAVRLETPTFEPITLSQRPLEPGQPVLMTKVSNAGEASAHAAMIASYASASSQELGMVHQLDTSSPNITPGSPLVDENGELVGVVVLANNGNVCLPVSSITRLIELAQSNSPSDLHPGRLGIGLGGVSETSVSDLMNDSPASEAGLKPGDRIVSVGGQATATAAELIAAVSTHRGGDKVEVVAERDGNETRYEIELDPDMSSRGKLPSIQAKMWRLENGKLVPMDDKLGGEAPKNPEPLPNLGLPNANGPIMITPRELRGFTVERSGLDEAMRNLQKIVQQQEKQNRALQEELHRFQQKADSLQNQPRMEQPDVNKLQRLLESLQEEIQSLKADRD